MVYRTTYSSAYAGSTVSSDSTSTVAITDSDYNEIYTYDRYYTFTQTASNSGDDQEEEKSSDILDIQRSFLPLKVELNNINKQYKMKEFNINRRYRKKSSKNCREFRLRGIK